MSAQSLQQNRLWRATCEATANSKQARSRRDAINKHSLPEKPRCSFSSLLERAATLVDNPFAEA
eukprot:6478421-Amphidinium_carterae.1